MRKLIKKSNGFTLVELLIVIALIAILSVAVLATINPIEQANKARDASMKNDAAEILAAAERFYASQGGYPWTLGYSAGADVGVSIGTPIAVQGSDPAFGVLGLGESKGVLITTSELKESFASKKPFDDPKDEDKMYLYNNGSDKNYVCFIPKANANRVTGGTPNPNLKCMTLGKSSFATLKDKGGVCSTVSTWDSLDVGSSKANLLCVPEGNVN